MWMDVSFTRTSIMYDSKHFQITHTIAVINPTMLRNKNSLLRSLVYSFDLPPVYESGRSIRNALTIIKHSSMHARNILLYWWYAMHTTILRQILFPASYTHLHREDNPCRNLSTKLHVHTQVNVHMHAMKN